jgi:predicted enzyme related to lactoylglutathione lyase
MANPVVHFEVIGDAEDPAAVAQFYTGLFGWKTSVYDGDNPYIIIDTGSADGINGGIGAEPGKMLVTVYVAVDDLQATLDKAEELGGKTVMPVTEVGESLTIAHLADPQGNVLGLVPAAGPPPERKDSGGQYPVVHFEILATDGPAAKDFWVKLFGWEVRDVAQMNYSLISAEDHGIPGGIGQNPTGGNQVTFYARADDMQGMLDKVKDMGGRTVTAPMTVPNGPMLAHFSDPQGNVIGIVAPADISQLGRGPRGQ